MQILHTNNKSYNLDAIYLWEKGKLLIGNDFYPSFHINENLLYNSNTSHINIYSYYYGYNVVHSKNIIINNTISFGNPVYDA